MKKYQNIIYSLSTVLIPLFALFILFSYNDFLLIKYENVLHNDISGITHVIKTEVLMNNEEKIFTGNSFHIGGGYILTCAHVVKFNEKQSVSTPFGNINIMVKWSNYKYSMNNKNIKLIGTKDDIVVFYNYDLIDSPKVIFGNSDKLEVGNKLIMIGNSQMKGINIKTGIVSKLFIDKPILNLPEITALNTFITTVPTIGGDSGGPILAIDKYTKKYYLIGMIYAATRYKEGYNYGFKSNYLMSTTEKLIKQYKIKINRDRRRNL